MEVLSDCPPGDGVLIDQRHFRAKIALFCCSPLKLRLPLLGRERVDKRRPPLINLFKNEHGIINSSVHEIPFAIFGLSGSMSISFRAARMVAANRMANFLSSVISRAYTPPCTSPHGMSRPCASNRFGRSGRGSGRGEK